MNGGFRTRGNSCNHSIKQRGEIERLAKQMELRMGPRRTEQVLSKCHKCDKGIYYKLRITA